MSARSAAVVLGLEGEIREIVFDGVGLKRALRGKAGLSLFVDGAYAKASLMLGEARAQGIAADWELSLSTVDGPKMARVSATKLPDSLFVVCHADASDAYDLYDELMRINNEQTNQLRAALKRIARQQRPAQPDAASLEALTRLTNELGVLQRSLAKKNVELERLNRRKDQILGMVAHDLRTPLGSIGGFARFVRRKSKDTLDPRSGLMLERIETASAFMLGLVEDLLDLSVIQSGEIQLHTERIRLGDVLDDVVEINRSLAAQKDIDIELEVEDCELVADPRKLQQVVTNLLTNAVKFSPPGTTVRVSGCARGGQARVAVRDEGQGIPPDEQGKIFDIYSTTSVKGTAGEKSTGLGLAIVRRVVEAHGGEIRVVSEVGVGSTFELTLPLERAPEHADHRTRDGR